MLPSSGVRELDFLRSDLHSFHQSDTKCREIQRKGDVAVIGGGLAGVIIGRSLAKHGHTVSIFEEQKQLGGTWVANAYPESRVDIPGLVYWPSSFGYERFASIYPTRSELQSSLLGVNAKLETEVEVNLRCRVTEANWKAGEHTWEICWINQQNQVRIQSFKYVVFAPGKLSSPLSIPGSQNLRPGRALHLHTYSFEPPEDLENKRIAVVGSGASALQASIGFAKQAKSLDVVQRNPNWIRSVPHLRSRQDPTLLGLLDNISTFRSLYRIQNIHKSIRGDLDAVLVQENWNEPGSVSEANAALREALANQMEAWFSSLPYEDKDLIPEFAPGAKRILLDDGSFATTLAQENVTLHTKAEASAKSDGLILSNGREINVDLVVWANGFSPAESLNRTRIIGVDGGSLSEHLKMSSSNLCGTMVNGFPNLFLGWGPNLNVVVSGSNTHMMEIQSSLVQGLISRSETFPHKVVSPTLEAQREFSRYVAEQNSARAWGHTSHLSWYQNKNGVTTENWPGDTVDYFEMCTHSLEGGYQFW